MLTDTSGATLPIGWKPVHELVQRWYSAVPVTVPLCGPSEMDRAGLGKAKNTPLEDAAPLAGGAARLEDHTAGTRRRLRLILGHLRASLLQGVDV